MFVGVHNMQVCFGLCVVCVCARVRKEDVLNKFYRNLHEKVGLGTLEEGEREREYVLANCLV